MLRDVPATRMYAAIGVLRAAMLGALVVPVALFVLVAWQDYLSVTRAAEATIQRTVSVLREHALKVFETSQLAIGQADERLRGLDWPEIASSPDVHDFLLRTDASLAQVSQIAVIDPDGRIRNSSGFMPPAPAATVVDRDFFIALREKDVGLYFSRGYKALLDRETTFDIASRRSTPDGRFDGIIRVTMDPAYFVQFYSSVVIGGDDAIALIRSDGAILMRGPRPIAASAALGRDSPFMRASGLADRGLYTGKSTLDGVDRMWGFARLDGYPVFVNFGISRATVLATWYHDLGLYAIFTVPGTLALLGLTWLALRWAAALKESEAGYRTLYSRTPIPLNTLDAKGRVISASDHWLAMLGYEREEVIGRPITDFQTAESAREFRDIYWPRIQQENALLEVERRYLAKDGHVVDTLLSAQLERDRAGRPYRVHSALVDITLRKRAEHALRRERELSGFLLKSSTEGIVGIDRELRVTLWNPAIEMMTGRSAAAAIGQPVFAVLPEAQGSGAAASWRAALDGEVAEIRDRSYVAPLTDRPGFFEARFAPLRGEAGAIIGAVALVRDTTERHRLEETLRQSQKMEAVGQLTGGIAHDFNNLLTAVIGNLQLVDDQLPEGAPAKRQIAAAQRAADRGARLTSQLLAFARRQPLRPEVRDINELIREFQNLTQRAAGDSVEMIFRTQPGLWLCRLDPAQFEAALLNLVVNARDAMPSGGTVTVETANVVLDSHDTRGLPAGDYVTLAVTDNGCGMSEEVMARASEPFFTTKEVGKGTGLGLSMVYGFARQSGGGMRIESTIGRGTRVDLYLPRAAAPPAADRGKAPTAAAMTGTGSILIVDDDADVRTTVAAVLHELGYEVFTVENGPAALELLRSGRRVDLLFSDIIMTGGMNGTELAEIVRREYPSLPAVLTSSYPPATGDPEFFLVKPYRREELAAKLRAVLARKPPGQATRQRAHRPIDA